MASNQTLVPDLRAKILIILASIVVGGIGLFEQRTKVTLEDGTVYTGKIVDEESDEEQLALERASGSIQWIARDAIASQSWWNFEVDLNLGLDLRGGTSLRYQIDLSDVPADEREETLMTTVRTFEDRLDAIGVKELAIRPLGENEISVELPGVTMEESQSYEQIVQSLGSLQFRIYAQSRQGFLDRNAEEERLRAHLEQLEESGEDWGPRSIDLTQFDVEGPGGVVYRWFPWSDKAIEEGSASADFPFQMLTIDPEMEFTGEDLEGVRPTLDERGFAALGFDIRSARAGDFGEFTGSHVGQQMAIVLDGEIHSAPVLQSEISDSGVINGGSAGFKPEELQRYETVLESGSLKVKPELLSKATIGPTLGEASIDRGIIAGVLALLLVVVFILWYYRLAGVIACATLLLGMFLMVGGLGFLEATLTLPGIAGILLTVGMAIDQNILINERIREEREKGKTLAQSVKNGFERAFVTIVDAQATTFIAAVILYFEGTGPIKGFAATLMIGIIATMFAAIVGSKSIYAWGLGSGWLKDLKLRSLLGDAKFHFTKYLKPALTSSIAILVIGMGFFFYDYDALRGLDFAGGFQAHVRLAQPMTQAEVESAVHAKYPSAQIVSMRGVAGVAELAGDGDGVRDYQIKIRAADDEEVAGDARDRYVRDLTAILGDRMLPDAIDDLTIQPAETGLRTSSSFQLNLTGPVNQDLIRNRLQERAAVERLEPVGGSAPASSYEVALAFNTAVDAARVKGEVASALDDLPNGVGLSDPVPESTFIGSRVGQELRNKAILAILYSLIAILIYIRVRFSDFNHGFAAAVAALHDVLFCLGAVTLVHMLGLINVELDLAMIGAFLTILGYSLNDTIVIFDRVRENVPRMSGSYDDVVNTSINQTLSRTALTSGTTLLAVLVLFFVNYGQRNVIEGFAFVIGVGVIIGTYSTIFIASPMLVWLNKRSEDRRAAAKAALTSTAR